MGNVKVQKRKVQFRIRKKNRKKIRDKGHEKKKIGRASCRERVCLYV